MSDLRPTLFLAQLSNLLAGNISIVHGVTGMSRTFMGEESAGIDAVRIALSRIQAGQSDISLVGGSFNAERKDILLLFEAGGYALKEPFAPVWERAARGGGMARWIARSVPGPGIARPRDRPQREAACAPCKRAIRPRQTAARRGGGLACPDVEDCCRAGRPRTSGGDLRRVRGRACDG